LCFAHEHIINAACQDNRADPPSVETADSGSIDPEQRLNNGGKADHVPFKTPNCSQLTGTNTISDIDFSIPANAIL